GPAGGGQTFLAGVLACQMLRDGQVKRGVLTRPAVEAGGNLGFLPGGLREKVDPHLRPLPAGLRTGLGTEQNGRRIGRGVIEGGLHTGPGTEQTDRRIERGVIEVAPLAYMRGRTLNDAFCILDEAQSTTEMQMKMFLTRLGFGSKMVVTGDEPQIDLPGSSKS